MQKSENNVSDLAKAVGSKRNGSVGQFQGTILGRTVKLEYNKLGYNKLQLKMNKQISLADLGKLTK
jgi:hypothetical protein